MDIRKALGREVRRLRLAEGISQEKLAHRADLTATYVSQVERGLRSPTLSTLVRLANALEIPAWLLVKNVVE